MPALFFVMLCCLPFAYMWLLPRHLKDFCQSLTAVTAFSSNILFWLQSGYFGVASELKPLLHTWSLAVEEQYYVLFPLFLMLLWKLRKRWIFGALMVVGAMSLAAAQWGAYNKPSATFFMLHTRAWELAIGASIAFYFLYKKEHAELIKRHKKTSEVFGAVGLLMIFYSVFTFNSTTPFPSLYALIPTVGTGLVIIFATSETAAGKLLSTKFMVGVGLISYSTYLWHQPLFVFARHRSLEEPSAALLLMLSAASLLLAYISWRYVESPFRNKKLISRNAIFTFTVVGSVVFAGIGLTGHLSNGFDGRFEKGFKGDVGHLEYNRYIDEKYFDCSPNSIASDALKWEGFLRCKQSKVGEPEIVLLGDSHAEHLFLGLAEILKDKNIVYYIKGGAPYYSNKHFENIFEHLLSSDNKKTVYLTMRYLYRVKDITELKSGFSDTVKRLQEAGHNVIILGDVPEFETSAEYCLYESEVVKNNLCYVDENVAKEKERYFSETLSGIANEFNVKYFPLYDPLCSSGVCSMIDGDKILYRDDNHLNILGSIALGRYIAELSMQ